MAGKFKNGMYKLFGLEPETKPSPPEQPPARPDPAATTSQRGPSGKYSGGYTGGGAPTGRIPREGGTPYSRERDPSPSGRNYDTASTPRVTSRRGDGASPLVSMPGGASMHDTNAGGAVQMIVYQLQSYDDTQRVVDELNAGRTVIVSTERLKTEIAQRALDFIGGAIYALNGNHRKIARGIFVFAPGNVDISGSYANVLPPEMRSPR